MAETSAGQQAGGGAGRAFWRGLRDCSPFVLVVLPFSVLFGVVARDAGLDLLQTMSMSVIVIAGAAQFTALSLLRDGAPVFVAILAALAVNLRMAMYSAALVPHLGRAPLGVRALMAYFMVDQTFAVSVRTYEAEPAMPLGQRIAYYFGCIASVCPLWYGGTLFGALVGQAIPPALSLDFALPACFIALFAPMLRSLPHLAAAGVSVLGAILFAGLPWNLGLVAAGLLAMIAGAQVEFWQRRRAARQGEARP